MSRLSRIGCLALVGLAIAAAWITRDRWLHRVTNRAPATATAPVWEALTPERAARRLHP